jgi:hypothetical protein
LASFTADRNAIAGNVSDWDVFQWAIEDTLCWDPDAVVHSVGDGTDRLYFKTWEHPGTSPLPRCVVVFRIAEPPAADAPGLLEGHRIFKLSDLNGDPVAFSPLG